MKVSENRKRNQILIEFDCKRKKNPKEEINRSLSSSCWCPNSLSLNHHLISLPFCCYLDHSMKWNIEIKITQYSCQWIGNRPINIYIEKERDVVWWATMTHTHTHTHTDKMTMTNNNLQMTKIEILNSFIYLSIILFSSIIQPKKNCWQHSKKK